MFRNTNGISGRKMFMYETIWTYKRLFIYRAISSMAYESTHNPFVYKAVYCLSATHRLCQKKPQQQIIYEACFCLLDSTLSRKIVRKVQFLTFNCNVHFDQACILYCTSYLILYCRQYLFCSIQFKHINISASSTNSAHAN